MEQLFIHDILELVEGLPDSEKLAFVQRLADPAPTHFDDNYWGACPECRSANGVLVRNVNRCHWFCCDRHRLKWYIGANLFSAWREEPECVWLENAELLDTYRDVEPLQCVCVQCVQDALRRGATIGGNEDIEF